jgi:hypothetical protein
MWASEPVKKRHASLFYILARNLPKVKRSGEFCAFAIKKDMPAFASAA